MLGKRVTANVGKTERSYSHRLGGPRPIFERFRKIYNERPGTDCALAV